MSTSTSSPARTDAAMLPALPQGFSPTRSVAIAAALSLHLALAAMLAMPIAAPESEPPAPTPVAVVFEPPKPPPRIDPPPPIVRPVTRVVPPQPRPLPPTPMPVSEPLAGPTVDTASPLDPPAMPTDAGPGDIDAGPAVESLQLRSGTPPRYPRGALSRRLEGEVELLILVGVDGKPESVSVSRSSGHAVLDRAARDHVLRRWVFVPSHRHGIAVPAYARVPVRFTLP